MNSLFKKALIALTVVGSAPAMMQASGSWRDLMNSVNDYLTKDVTAKVFSKEAAIILGGFIGIGALVNKFVIHRNYVPGKNTQSVE